MTHPLDVDAPPARAPEPASTRATESEIDLRPFCGTEVTRVYLMKPFSRGDWTYASDGRILVRVPRRASVPDDADNSASVEKIIAEHPLPALRPFRGVKIPDAKSEEIECRECKGRGTEHDCPDCTCDCQECEGTGKCEGREEVSIDIGGVPFAARYGRLIQLLPDLHVPQAVTPEAPMPFAFKGGEGILMPLRSPHKKHLAESP